MGNKAIINCNFINVKYLDEAIALTKERLYEQTFLNDSSNLILIFSIQCHLENLQDMRSAILN